MQFRPPPLPQVRAPAPAHRSPSSDRDCPLRTARDRCLWHAGGTAGENDDRSNGARPVTWAIGCAGWSGDADIKPAPAPATTDDKPPDHGDHNLWLQYAVVLPGVRRGLNLRHGLPICLVEVIEATRRAGRVRMVRSPVSFVLFTTPGGPLTSPEGHRCSSNDEHSSRSRDHD
jgi:hypothetical protein